MPMHLVQSPTGCIRLLGWAPTTGFPGPSAAFESFDHLIGSPATIGSDRFNDLGDLFFGEREAIKLAFNERGVVVGYSTESHASHATAIPLELATLPVPNTLERGLHANKQFLVSALAVVGSIELDGAASESDWYSMTGLVLQSVNIDLYSSGLSRLSDQPQPHLHTIDSVVRVYRLNGGTHRNLCRTSRDSPKTMTSLEPTDSSLLDLTLPCRWDLLH